MGRVAKDAALIEGNIFKPTYSPAKRELLPLMQLCSKFVPRMFPPSAAEESDICKAAMLTTLCDFSLLQITTSMYAFPVSRSST